MKRAIAIILCISAAVLTTYLLFTHDAAEDSLGFSLVISILPITCIGADYFASAQCGNLHARETDDFLDKAVEYCSIHDKPLKHRVELVRSMRSNCFTAHKMLYIFSALLAFCTMCFAVNGYMRPIHFSLAGIIAAIIACFPFHAAFPYKKANRLDFDSLNNISETQEKRKYILRLIEKITPQNTITKTDCLSYAILGLIGGSDLLFAYSALQYNATLGICSSLIVYSTVNLLLMLI